MKKLVFIFVDGLGLGSNDPEINPLIRFDFPTFKHLAGDQSFIASSPDVIRDRHVFKSIDANLSVDGLPQSGTGQATIFTGVNCARLAGKHYGPFPHSTSAEVIKSKNIFSRLMDSGKAKSTELAFANTYPQRFFSYVDRTNRWTVTTRCCMSAGILIRTTTHLSQGNGVAADITGEGLLRIEPDIPIFDENSAAGNLLRVAAEMRFTLFEYFHTDKAGHSQSFDRAEKRLKSLDAFFGALLAQLDDETLILITSDHGNIEDLSTKSHTRNNVPLIAFGPDARHFAQIEDLSGIAEQIVSWYT